MYDIVHKLVIIRGIQIYGKIYSYLTKYTNDLRKTNSRSPIQNYIIGNPVNIRNTFMYAAPLVCLTCKGNKYGITITIYFSYLK